MFLIEIKFTDGISAPEKVIVLRPIVIVGSSELAHVVIEGATINIKELQIIRMLGRSFLVSPLKKVGTTLALTKDFDFYNTTAEIDLGGVLLTITSLDLETIDKVDNINEIISSNYVSRMVNQDEILFPALVVESNRSTFVCSFSDMRPCVVGRGKNAHVRIDSSDISSRHALITFEKGKYFLEDLQSTNGTFVNAEKLIGKRQINNSDSILIGSLYQIRLVTNLQEYEACNVYSYIQSSPSKTVKSYPVIHCSSAQVQPNFLQFSKLHKILIGRDPENDIWVGAAHISRIHVEIVKNDDTFYIRDLSSNGTILNKKPLPHNIQVVLEKKFNEIDLGNNIILALCFSEEDEQFYVNSNNDLNIIETSTVDKNKLDEVITGESNKVDSLYVNNASKNDERESNQSKSNFLLDPNTQFEELDLEPPILQGFLKNLIIFSTLVLFIIILFISITIFD